MNLTIGQLRAFVTVARLSSFTEAAKRLHLTQSALSVLVKDLERELDVRLLDRTTRSVKLTAAGTKFYDAAESSVLAFERARQSAHALSRAGKEVISMSAPQLTLCTVLVPAISEFLRQNPMLDVNVTDDALADVPFRVLTGDADLGISPDRSVGENLERKPLMRDILHLVCLPDEPVVRSKRVKWKDFVGHYPLITSREFTSRARLDLGVEAQNLHAEYEVSHLLTAFAMVQAGRGVTLAPMHAHRLATTFGLVMLPISEPQVVREFAILSRRDRPVSVAARRLVDFLIVAAAKGWPAT
ncbi:LysR family transcriptional regulator [Paraburkholderia sp. Ac-20347]|uniref:LysR family transcriptional regulator n=1 Tax=Paraburkholderia sp. Ac-20347 TaxID=2703892 RepID=UPI001980AF60|nr:LysR family transcriptional regulator [Paraburkholderia sp. Ac-20347]MBN3809950.1 LysR family transcriptional regulator [Paraburkholderia sp. Ac-20347]